MRRSFRVNNKFMVAALIFITLVISAGPAWAVTSNITRQSSNADFLNGTVENAVISSKGQISLGRSAEVLVEEFEDVWSVNTLVVSGGAVFIGTSPNGRIYKYSLGKFTKIYPQDSNQPEEAGPTENKTDQITEPARPDEPNQPVEPNQPGEPNDANAVDVKEHLSNEHIFVMSTDVAGRLLVGISGKKCRLIRLEAERIETIFEPNDAKYIFAIALGNDGDIYLGTGPQGKIYRLDSFGEESELFYDSTDKNILSLTTGSDGFLYAGSDSRGLIYRINTSTRVASVLYDSEQPEITALLFDQKGELYAVGTSAKIVQAQTKFASQLPLAGRPESEAATPKTAAENKGTLKLKIPNTNKGSQDKSSPKPPSSSKGPKPGKESDIYKITKDGFVTNIFSEAAVFLCMVRQEDKFLLGTGNSAQLYTIEPDSEQQAVIYEDEQASQITAVALAGDDVYIGTANPAKLVKLGKKFAAEGTFASDLIDASQPAKWGKLQIEADIPNGCKVMVSSRSGNVKDVNDPTFSQWTPPKEMTGPTQLDCPAGRFCQYKLILQGPAGQATPIVREVAVAHTLPNLAPKVESVNIERIEAPGKTGVFKINYNAKDGNNDKLIYKIDFRKLQRDRWIEIEDETEGENFEWDGKTVEDGRYEIRVTASDDRDNTSTTKLAGSRISELVIVDNTSPVIKKYSIKKNADKVTLQLRVFDEFSAIGHVHYTVDSNAEWIGTLPNDSVYDTTDEEFTIVIDGIKAGEHIVTIRISDDVGNTMYKTFEVTMGGN